MVHQEAVKAWEAEHDLAKEEKRKPRWTKPKQGLLQPFSCWYAPALPSILQVLLHQCGFPRIPLWPAQGLVWMSVFYIYDVNSHVTIPVVSFFTSAKSRAFNLSALFYCRTVVRMSDEECDSKCLFKLLFVPCHVTMSTRMISEMTLILTVCISVPRRCN